MNEIKKLTPSLEDYLETILILERKNRVARVKDIAENLGVQMPSVTGALKNLKSKALIEYEKNSFINLTPKGVEIAVSILKKHEILADFLKNILCISEDTAIEEACKIEHAINMETAVRLKNLTAYLKKSMNCDSELKDILKSK